MLWVLDLLLYVYYYSIIIDAKPENLTLGFDNSYCE